MNPHERTPTFQRYAQLYDSIYEDKDTESEVSFVLEQLRHGGLEGPSRILELGAGTGRHARLLADQGHIVVGVEASVDMVDRAISRENLTIVLGDARTVRLGVHFQAVVALFHVVSYQVNDCDLEQLFKTAAAHLVSGGLFGFDVWFSPAVHALRPEERIFEKETDVVSIVRRARPSENLARSLVFVEYDFTLKDKRSGRVEQFIEVHTMRHFCENEIRSFADAAGFEILTATAFLTGLEPSRDSWGVWFTARKR